MKQILAFLLLALSVPVLSSAEEITPNQAHCMNIAFASADTVNFMCSNTPREEIIIKLKARYSTISSHIEALVDDQFKLFSDTTCPPDRNTIIKSLFGACYASLSSMNGK